MSVPPKGNLPKWQEEGSVLTSSLGVRVGEVLIIENGSPWETRAVRLLKSWLLEL